MTMTPRERLMASLDGQPTDHVPVWLLFPYHATGYYVDVRQHAAYQPVFEASKQYAVMLDRRNLGVALHTPDVVWSDRAEGDVRTRTLRWKDVVLSTTSGGGANRKLLDTDEELEMWCRLPLNVDEAAIRRALDGKLPHYLAERADFPASFGAMMLDLGEPVGPLYHAANLESYAIWSLTHDDLVRQFLDRLMVQKRVVYRWCLEHDLADVYFLVGSELASPPLVSRETFQRWIVPYAKELIDLIHSYGKKVIQHYHGQIREILPDFLTMGPDALHTIEAPPVGNCTFTQAYEVTGDRITLIGNIQYDDFRAWDRATMAAHVREVIGECRGRRFILSPSAGPFDPAPPARLIENYLTFMETAWSEPAW